MTSENRITTGLIYDITDALERHGHYRGDDQHADRAIGLMADLARIWEGTQDHPADAHAITMPSPRPAYPGPSGQAGQTPSSSPAPTSAPCWPRWISPLTAAAARPSYAPAARTSPARPASPASATPRPATTWPPRYCGKPRPGRLRAASPRQMARQLLRTGPSAQPAGEAGQ